jgi:hypothetical protein
MQAQPRRLGTGRSTSLEATPANPSFPLSTVFVFAFGLAVYIVVLRGHLQRRANHGSICDSSLLTGPMTISGYAWGHIVATGP